MRRRRLGLNLLVLFALGLVLPPALLQSLSSAAPLQQLSNPLIIVSNEGQAGPSLDRTLVQGSSADPAPGWRERFFNPTGWLDAYPSMRAAAWTSGANIAPLLNDGADHIWGGTPGNLGPDAGNFTAYSRRDAGGANYANGYAIPGAPAPQYLFVRKDFCLPINAQADAQRRLTAGGGDVTLLNATDSAAVPDGPASVWLNTVNIGVVPGAESDTTTNLPVAADFLYRGRNALTMRAADARSDDMAAILYRASLGYAIDPAAIQVNVNPVNPIVGETVSFATPHDGLSDRPPYNYGWTFGDGGVGNGAGVNHAYALPGTYTVTLTIQDADGCTGIVSSLVSVAPNPLAIFKTAQPDPVNAGENLLYRITVQNNSPVRTLTNFVVTDTLPVNTSFVSCSGGCTTPALPNRTVVWSLGNLGPGASATLDLFVLVDPAASGTLTNAAYGARGNETSIAGAPVSVQVLAPVWTATPIPTDTPTPTKPPNTPTNTPTNTPINTLIDPINTPTSTSTALPPAPTATGRPTLVPPTDTPLPPAPTSPPPPPPTAAPALATPVFLPVSGHGSMGPWLVAPLALLLTLPLALVLASVASIARALRRKKSDPR